MWHRKKHKRTEAKVDIQMTPMLDMIFQLLVFFILTFKPVMDEGQFDITMSSVRGGSQASPVMMAGEGKIDDTTDPQDQFNLPIGVRLRASGDGRLAEKGIVLGDRIIPSIPDLQVALHSMVTSQGEELELIIEADTGLEYQYVVQVINAMSHAGIKKINFGPPRTDEG